MSPQTHRFLQTTRGQVLALLRQGAKTVDELARDLGLTDNAVRTHLATLERDGLARQGGVRRSLGAGKPATLYEIQPDAEPLLSRAYAPVLAALVEALVEHVPEERRAEVMESLGRRLAAGAGPPGRTFDRRVAAAAALLESWGAATAVERGEGALVVRGNGCPLSASTREHPELCRALEALLAEVIGAPVAACCERGERPRCRFEVAAPS